MDVYYNGNGNSWGQGRPETKLTAVPVGKTFLWGRQEVFLPAVYVGEAGAVLDICTKIPTEDMIYFLQKWDREKRLSASTKEDFEQLDADNPAAREFTATLRLNNQPLISCMASSIRWYPEEIFELESVQDSGERLTNDRSSEGLMSAYGCDKKCCWHFARHVYNWNGSPVLEPTEIFLGLQAHTFSVTAAHFTTDLCSDALHMAGNSSPVRETSDHIHPVNQHSFTVSSSHDTLPDKGLTATCDQYPARLKIIRPTDGQEFTLTLHGLEQTRHSFAEIGQEGIVYPEYCQILSYSITPEIGRDLFDLTDCTDSDQPRRKDTQENLLKEVTGPSAIFMAGKSPAPYRRSACSSLHFDPVSKVRWRAVFQVKEKEDIAISFSL